MLQFVREGYPHLLSFTYMSKSDWSIMLDSMQTRIQNLFPNSKGIIHCSQRGQPSHAAVEGEGRIVLY